ncbi:hypothetical protein [Streptomyces sp. NPDC057910]|uniref:hypothetical protein n=1 Tax=Streptomyces sp. NPDC057910 TaxID=3346278 RepID=UPI0036E69196
MTGLAKQDLVGLEQLRGRTPGGVVARVMQRILALTIAIRHQRPPDGPFCAH